MPVIRKYLNMYTIKEHYISGAIIPALMHRIPSELRSQACLGESSTRTGDLLGSPRVALLFCVLFFFLAYTIKPWWVHLFRDCELWGSLSFGNWQLDSLPRFEQLSFLTRLHPTSLSKVMTVWSLVTIIFGNSKSITILFNLRTPPSNIH